MSITDTASSSGMGFDAKLKAMLQQTTVAYLDSVMNAKAVFTAAGHAPNLDEVFSEFQQGTIVAPHDNEQAMIKISSTFRDIKESNFNVSLMAVTAELEALSKKYSIIKKLAGNVADINQAYARSFSKISEGVSDPEQLKELNVALQTHAFNLINQMVEPKQSTKSIASRADGMLGISGIVEPSRELVDTIARINKTPPLMAKMALGKFSDDFSAVLNKAADISQGRFV